MRQTQEKGWTFGPAPKRKNRNRNYAQLKVFLRRVSRQILAQVFGQILGQSCSDGFRQRYFVLYLRKKYKALLRVRAIPQR